MAQHDIFNTKPGKSNVNLSTCLKKHFRRQKEQKKKAAGGRDRQEVINVFVLFTEITNYYMLNNLNSSKGKILFLP